MPVTLPKTVGQTPLYYDQKNTGRPDRTILKGIARSRTASSPNSATNLS